MEREDLFKRLEEIKIDSKKINHFTLSMIEKGHKLEDLNGSIMDFKENLLKDIEIYFTEVELNPKKEQKDNPKVDLKAIASENKAKKKLLKEYKEIDNLVENLEPKTTIFSKIKFIIENEFDTIYSTYLTGTQLAKLFIDREIGFDKNIQRGIKTINKQLRANFKDSHVKDIYNSMINNSFTPTQIHLAYVEDGQKESLEDVEGGCSYLEEEDSLRCEGIIRMIDGQHRIRACVKLYREIEQGLEFDLDKYIFNTEIHVTDSNYARTIYSNINKNLKLDKSQVRQLSNDYSSKIVNKLAFDSESSLRGKIATCKPVKDKITLFSTLAEAIDKNSKIGSIKERNEISQYLMDFFDYLAYNCKEGFGNDVTERMKFKENNLLNENNAMLMWIKVALRDKAHYTENIDKILNEKEFFNKDNPYWLENSTVKYRKDNKGFAVNNTSSGLASLINKGVEIIERGR